MRKYVYPLIILACAAAYYFYENKANSTYSQENRSTKDFLNTDVNRKGIKSLSLKDFLPSSKNQIVNHHTYSLSYNEQHEQAEWTAHVLRASDINTSNYKRPYFEIDDQVTTGAAHWRNYKKSGYDKGHLVPAGDRKSTKAAHDETFLTSNISPQRHDFNAGIWNTLEQKTRYYAKRYEELYVITGSVLTDDLKSIGTEKVSVPEQYYKILYRYDANGGKMLAFLMPHENSTQSIYNFITSVDEIEILTGTDFFAQLPDNMEDELEAGKSSKGW
ncbi:DNA/RNA non-specific endonuclease [Nonlabens sp. Ci31]|uniref:DNA/RNA non-specific endonuclease n=1 Tax=Nonlabens sp. Ci31 TaxID=2608253 RepID=UPI001462B77F|nr:DNA/RNA non-specific endonuclease [Nonlabens sp. Ci31]QJP33293.1 DNA/RNA non-specific endonuclease [Nonlabens sp. Ci31]